MRSQITVSAKLDVVPLALLAREYAHCLPPGQPNYSALLRIALAKIAADLCPPNQRPTPIDALAELAQRGYPTAQLHTPSERQALAPTAQPRPMYQPLPDLPDTLVAGVSAALHNLTPLTEE